MKVLGFAVVALGIIIMYIGITGSQHRIMSIISRKPEVKSGQQVNPSGPGFPQPSQPKSKSKGGSSGVLV